MARRKNSNPFDGEDAPAMDVSPLIDVAFLLLIYFLVTATLLKQEADLGLALPGVASLSNAPVDVDQMVIKIEANSNVQVNDELVESNPDSRQLRNLTDRLTRYAAGAKIAKSEAMVVINCHNDAREQRFVDVLNACAAAGLKNISLTD
ncbi:MAG: biopolymer transporter ExbD [Verrucomicrobiales bacterium]|nr:biopolymer transporter ExbD [Verrucomicrobiales bacterium]